MKIRNLFALIASIFVFSSFVQAATIQGELYGPDLSLIEEAQVKIYQEGKVIESVIVNGSYSIDLNPGEYDIEGVLIDNGEVILIGRESIKINDGEYNIDLILLPILDNDPDEFDPETDLGDDKNYAIPILIIVLLLAVFYAYRKKGALKMKITKDDLPKDLKDIINIMKDSGGRINQLELRKKLPYSEAKVSLMIADLESKGMIKKIKKGRGNILVLNS